MASCRENVPASSSLALLTDQNEPSLFLHSGAVITMWGGPFHVELSEMWASIAAASVNGLNALPAWRPAPSVARLNWLLAKFWPPTMARIAPVFGSMATSAAEGSPGVFRMLAMACSAWCCMARSSVVVTRRPPEKVSVYP